MHNVGNQEETIGLNDSQDAWQLSAALVATGRDRKNRIAPG